nr:MAG TPA: hypothetical protein [Caudoviricetes sp.]
MQANNYSEWMKFYKSNPAQLLEDYFGAKIPGYQKVLLRWMTRTSHLWVSLIYLKGR